MKQRIYLPTEYAEILADKARAVGVSPDFYVQTLIAQDHICGNGPAPIAAQMPATPATAPDTGIKLSGGWAEMAL